MTKYFEAVPNLSEGRDAAKVAAIVDEARAVPGVTVLDVESNPDHHRSVVSLVGPAAPLAEACFRMVRHAIQTIDLTKHHGEHPRMGAIDVVPFVPLGEATMPEAVTLSVGLAERVWKELHLPVYLYAEAARRPERQDLAYVRRGEFEGIRDSIASDPARAPDFGEPRVHPTAGIVAIGARPILVAYNAYLSTPDVAVAKKIAQAVRHRDGGLAEVKALGFEIRERNRAQVSMNLTDHRKTPMHRALEAVRREAQRYGVQVEETEIVGLVPEDALLDAAEYYLQLNRFDRAAVLERKVRAATAASPPPPATTTLAGTTIERFSELLAARTATPGGGSASAGVGAFGAALGQMVVAYSHKPEAPDPVLTEVYSKLGACRLRLLKGVDADSQAYDGLRDTRRALKKAPTDALAQSAYKEAVRNAVEVPLDTARASREAAAVVLPHRSRLRAQLESDLVTALALLDAAVAGALANATINLPDAESVGIDVAPIRAEIERLRPSPK